MQAHRLENKVRNSRKEKAKEKAYILCLNLHH